MQPMGLLYGGSAQQTARPSNEPTGNGSDADPVETRRVQRHSLTSSTSSLSSSSTSGSSSHQMSFVQSTASSRSRQTKEVSYANCIVVQETTQPRNKRKNNIAISSNKNNNLANLVVNQEGNNLYDETGKQQLAAMIDTTTKVDDHDDDDLHETSTYDFRTRRRMLQNKLCPSSEAALVANNGSLGTNGSNSLTSGLGGCDVNDAKSTAVFEASYGEERDKFCCYMNEKTVGSSRAAAVAQVHDNRMLLQLHPAARTVNDSSAEPVSLPARLSSSSSSLLDCSKKVQVVFSETATRRSNCQESIVAQHGHNNGQRSPVEDRAEEDAASECSSAPPTPPPRLSSLPPERRPPSLHMPNGSCPSDSSTCSSGSSPSSPMRQVKPPPPTHRCWPTGAQPAPSQSSTAEHLSQSTRLSNNNTNNRLISAAAVNTGNHINGNRMQSAAPNQQVRLPAQHWPPPPPTQAMPPTNEEDGFGHSKRAPITKALQEMFKQQQYLNQSNQQHSRQVQTGANNHVIHRPASQPHPLYPHPLQFSRQVRNCPLPPIPSGTGSPTVTARPYIVQRPPPLGRQSRLSSSSMSASSSSISSATSSSSSCLAAPRTHLQSSQVQAKPVINIAKPPPTTKISDDSVQLLVSGGDCTEALDPASCTGEPPASDPVLQRQHSSPELPLRNEPTAASVDQASSSSSSSSSSTQAGKALAAQQAGCVESMKMETKKPSDTCCGIISVPTDTMPASPVQPRTAGSQQQQWPSERVAAMLAAAQLQKAAAAADKQQKLPTLQQVQQQIQQVRSSFLTTSSLLPATRNGSPFGGSYGNSSSSSSSAALSSKPPGESASQRQSAATATANSAAAATTTTKHSPESYCCATTPKTTTPSTTSSDDNYHLSGDDKQERSDSVDQDESRRVAAANNSCDRQVKSQEAPKSNDLNTPLSISINSSSSSLASANKIVAKDKPEVEKPESPLSLMLSSKSVSSRDEIAAAAAAAPKPDSSMAALIKEASLIDGSSSDQLIPKLIERLDRKLVVMKEEQLSLMREIELNERLGRRLFDSMKSRLTVKEFEKITLHAEEIEKVTKLRLSLKMRLKRIEAELANQRTSAAQQDESPNDPPVTSTCEPTRSSPKQPKQLRSSSQSASQRAVSLRVTTTADAGAPSTVKQLISHGQSTANHQSSSLRAHHHHHHQSSTGVALRNVSDPTASQAQDSGKQARNKHQHHSSLQSTPTDSRPDSGSETNNNSSSDSIFNCADSAIGGSTIHGGSSANITQHQQQSHTTKATATSQASLIAQETRRQVSSAASSASVEEDSHLSASTSNISSVSSSASTHGGSSMNVSSPPGSMPNSPPLVISPDRISAQQQQQTNARYPIQQIGPTSAHMMMMLTDTDILVAKRNKLTSQLDEAYQLEECITERNGIIVERILKKYYHEHEDTEIGEFRQFTRLKSLLLKDTHDVADRIDQAELQILELKQTTTNTQHQLHHDNSMAQVDDPTDASKKSPQILQSHHSSDAATS